MNVLRIDNLYKSFGKEKVINGLSFEVPENEILGFLGKNGAGKTTTMKMILGFVKPDSGIIEVCGEKVEYGFSKTNRFIGYLPDVPNFYGYMTSKEYLMLCADITGLQKDYAFRRIEELLKLVGLENNDKRINGFSRGMKQRLGIAQALINKPRILICDEPTSALDPVGRKDILDILNKIKKNTTVIFSTHILSDVESICDSVIILDEGKNILEGSIEELKSIKKINEIVIKFKEKNQSEEFGKKLCLNNIIYEINDDKIIIKNDSNHNIEKRILEQLCISGFFPIEMKVKESTLQDIFMEVIKR
ncbi:ABC transporter ATP-binding protein [Helcococcus kunzii]|uniref:ABC transporter domain-containing protein n=1 Tax=Helcococcus kunzii ATCC 51366 TaxID=883114 RepID=H3NL77_9FIRM|nr:ABC transporter ATP-binding protein [Helcococcus kunzii]EHR36058.1 hypothetical protein HMPREF9709_00154 [Helcococcus kunzii ATCC 51366]MCT1796641.1 ABC transporter ATP-binding protein [Helcococcus kunzii]QUY64101.1 ABC transporter ATP-binding protein [Helcococcus kunzii]QZO76554.1 ABC transporter ATP-binding protein [Helcococcus kunzii]